MGVGAGEPRETFTDGRRLQPRWRESEQVGGLRIDKDIYISRTWTVGLGVCVKPNSSSSVFPVCGENPTCYTHCSWTSQEVDVIAEA